MPLSAELKDVGIEENSLHFKNAKGAQVSVDIRDVIGYHVNKEGSHPPKIIDGAKHSAAVNLLYISRPTDPKVFKWKTETLNLMGEMTEAENWTQTLDKKRKDLGKPQKLVVFLNPIGGGQNARSVYQKTAGPLFELAGIQCEVLVSERPKHFTDLAAAFDFSSVDGIVILGGDGSICEILNALMRKMHGQDVKDPKPIDIPIGVIPTGTGNGFSEGSYGVQNELTSVLHIINGTTQPQSLMSVHSGGSLLSMSCCVIAYGLFSDVMYHTDKQRWLKRLRYAVVPFWVMLVKKQRLFNARVTYTVRENESESEESQKEAVEKITEKEFSGTFQNFASFVGDIIDESGHFDFKQSKREVHRDRFNIVAYKECARLSLVNSFGQMFLRSPDAVIFEGPLWLLMTVIVAEHNRLCRSFIPYCKDPRDVVLKTVKPCTRFSYLKTFLDFAMGKDSAFNKDFIDVYTTVSYKVQVLPPGTPSESQGEGTDDKTTEPDKGAEVAKSSENSEEVHKDEKSEAKEEIETVQESEKVESEQQEGADGARSSDKQERESEETYLQKLIDIDGEIFEITDNEYEVRMHPNMIRVFSSLSHTEPQNI